ncbi:MAG: PilZ domain-containing protein [Rhodanobacter sp.]|nr:MAG: PilZ domain-containing protein [Rhodanobacter sp.]TAM13357.1 MAG: PilZ domain-containing protein [Rhodanobacter sp.]TAM35084.1 MAG: PilZ domain-containing protein [Rhodanobacter sp.]
MSPHEQRRTPRRPVAAGVVATDVISERPLGHLCNLSTGGMLLIGKHEPRSEAIHQVRVTLPGERHPIELGVQEQWHDAAATPGQFWAGYRIIAITKEHEKLLETWLRMA